MKLTPKLTPTGKLTPTAGLTSIDWILVVSVSVLVAAVVWPHHLVSGILESETVAAAEVGDLAARLGDHRDRALTDVDGDGVGEFPPLDRVLGSRAEQFRRIEGTHAYERGGYYFALLLPDARGEPVEATSPRVHLEYAEVSCVLTAWPVERGSTGMRAFCWRPADGLLKHAVDGYPYGGPDDPPLPPGSMVGGQFPNWRSARYEGNEWIHRK